MKSVSALLVAAVLLASAALDEASYVQTRTPKKQATKDYAKKQKTILRFLYGIGHDHTFKSEFDDYDIVGNTEYYTEPSVVKEFSYAFKHRFLPKDGHFSLSCEKTLSDTVKLFDLFFFARDFDTFYKTACWARRHVNGAQFVYALYIAVYHRHDCRNIALPPLYEVFPHAFLTSDLVHKLYDARMEGRENIKVYLNNSGYEDYWHRGMFGGVLYKPMDNPTQHVEDRLSYFREDVGISEFLAQFSLVYPTWFNQAKYKKIKNFRTGELYYYLLQQFYARYSLERFANFMPNTEVLLWDKPIKAGYNPNLMTFDGHAYFARPDNMIPEEFNAFRVHKAQTYESRILGALDADTLYLTVNNSYMSLGPDVINSLGDIVMGTPQSASLHFYGNYFQTSMEAIAYMVRTGADTNLVSGALGSFLTAAKDPAFYMLLHRIVKIFQQHKKTLPHYTDKDLSFPGVKIDLVKMENLVTYFDRYDFEVTNSVPIHGEKTYKDYLYVARQFRINHKPFHYAITITADRACDGIIRFFIGPKYDSLGNPMNLEQSRMAFVEFDRFTVKLTKGHNTFERMSKESPAFVEDPDGLRAISDRLEEDMDEELTVTEARRFGFPDRFLLPKGTKKGQPFTVFAVVSPYEKKATPPPEERIFDTYITLGGSKFYDGRAYGFPFDRKIPYDEVFHLDNAVFKEVIVQHKEEVEINRLADH